MELKPAGKEQNELPGQNSSVTQETESEIFQQKNESTTDALETASERRARHRSHLVAYSTQFVMAVGVSIVQSGVWAYLRQLDDTVGKTQLGLAVAASPVGQMLASPLLGHWGNRSGSVRLPCIVALLMYILGNLMYATLYAYTDTEHHVAFYVLLVTRFILGMSAANTTLSRSYISGATTVAERTPGLARNAAAQSAGYVVGPALQAILVRSPTYVSGVPGLVWDKYTSVGWVAAGLGCLNLVLLMPGVFTEHYIAAKEFKATQESSEPSSSEKPKELPRPNYRGVAAMATSFGMLMYSASARETLATPLTIEQYGIQDDLAVMYCSIVIATTTALGIVVLMLVTRYTRNVDTRKVLILAGFLPVVIGVFLHYPMGTVPIVPQDPECVANMTEGDSQVCPGCPLDEQPWCETTYQITPAQLIITFFIVNNGFGIAMSYCQSVYTKIFGPTPMGVWLSLLAACSCLARMTGPMWSAQVYEHWGTKYTYIILGILESIAMMILVISYKNLEPMNERLKREELSGKDNEAYLESN